MTIENPKAHYVPFEINTDADVQDFVVPPTEMVTGMVENLADTWKDELDITEFLDHSVTQIRNAQALADAADAKAKFAQKTAKGFRANVEYRRMLIEAALNAAVSRGLMGQPKVKSAEYSLGIQGTAGSVQVDPDLDMWREDVQTELEFISQLLLTQVMCGAPIELPEDVIERLAKMSLAYMDNCNPAENMDFKILSAKTAITWDKKYLGQALKNNWLTLKLAGLFTVVKGKALVIRL